MKRKRRLKKWVKKLIVITILIFIIFIVNTQIKKNREIEKNSDRIELINENNNSNLNRYILAEGFYYEKLSDEIKKKITGHSFPKFFDKKYTSIKYEDLRYLKVKHYDFSLQEHEDGEMIVNKDVAEGVLSIFYELYKNKYPIEKIKLIEEYDANDELSMKDNNTSAFNYRIVENSDKLSWHCFGLAIDINPLYNPYVIGEKIYPTTAKKYVNRKKDFLGKIDHDDLAYKLFKEKGWNWGGDFINEKDYQHFYKDKYSEQIRKVKGKE